MSENTNETDRKQRAFETIARLFQLWLAEYHPGEVTALVVEPHTGKVLLRRSDPFDAAALLMHAKGEEAKR